MEKCEFRTISVTLVTFPVCVCVCVGVICLCERQQFILTLTVIAVISHNVCPVTLPRNKLIAF